MKDKSLELPTEKESSSENGDVPDTSENLPDTLPVIPLVNRVLFPRTVVPVTVDRESTRELVEEVLPKQHLIGFVAPKPEPEEGAGTENLYTMGVTAKVLKLMRPGEDNLVIIVQVIERILIKDYTQTQPYLVAQVERVEQKLPERDDDYWEAAIRNLREAAVDLAERNPDIPPEAHDALREIDDPAMLTDVVAGNLAIPVEERQDLLEQTDVVRRVETVQRILGRQLEISDIQAKLREDVQSELSDSQRRAYLREQLRAIQKELGDSDGAVEQVEELRVKLEEAHLPEEIMGEAERELKRLGAIPTASQEYSVIVTYLETLSELPWDKEADPEVDLAKAQEILDRDHFGLEKVKRRLIEYLAVRKLNPDGHGPILCLLGPPGVGKTSLGRSIAAALGRQFSRIALGGIRDEAEIRGHRRTYVGAMPGRLIQELRRVGENNPVVMLDEIDKQGADFRGDPASAFLEVLDPHQNHAFVDRYLDVPFDLSNVIFIATANVIDTVPPPLRDRMEIIQLPGYTEKEKLEIAKRYIVARQLTENGIDDKLCRWTDGALKTIIEDYTREAGVRNLDREIGSVTRWIAAKVAGGETGGHEVTPDVVADALGPPKFVREDAIRESQPGVVNGLAYTSVGGEVLHIEAVRYPGKGNVKLTGQLGDVMKESVTIAGSLVRTRAEKLGIAPKDFNDYDIHLHVPAGAIPKDGPSAGTAMFTAIASLFSDEPVRADVAMTGEVTLRGLVLPIGGLKEKLLAAHRAGVKRVLIPELNQKDLVDVPQEVRDDLEIVPVENVGQVLAAALG